MIHNNILHEALKNFLFPNICAYCGEISSSLLCEKCSSKIIKIKELSCNFCGYPKNFENDIFESDYKDNDLKGFGEKTQNNKSDIFQNSKCSICSNLDFKFYKLRSFGIYNGVLKQLILKFKYKKIYNLAPILSSFLEETFLNHYKNEKIDYIETVPDFIININTDINKDFDNYSYSKINHMQILASLLSQQLKIPFANNLIKIKKTLRQQNLDIFERNVNLKDAFKVINILKIYNKNILVIDDVWTTGNTLNEISKLLKRCGANKIYLMTIARAI